MFTYFGSEKNDDLIIIIIRLFSHVVFIDTTI